MPRKSTIQEAMQKKHLPESPAATIDGQNTVATKKERKRGV